jgi:hypothetical protein
MTIPKDSVKARNIRQNNKGTVTINTDKAPIKRVIIGETAKFEELSDEAKRKFDRRISAKYVMHAMHAHHRIPYMSVRNLGFYSSDVTKEMMRNAVKMRKLRWSADRS